MNSFVEISQQIKSKAIELGFDDCGIAPANYYPELEERLKSWVDAGFHGTMEYMAERLNQRADIGLFFPEARSVIVVVASYNFGKVRTASKYKVARFALVSDYHFVIKERLHHLIDFITQHYPEAQCSLSVDAQPVAERFWAVKAGLGFIGQNSMFIHPTLGSFVFLGTITTNLAMAYDSPNTQSCLSCGKCLKACPNGAIIKPFVVDARKCISYLTIEYRGELESEGGVQLASNLFGCDVCNEVCPHNANDIISASKIFQLKQNIINFSDADWEQMGSNRFKRELSSTPLRRAGLKLLRRNIRKINPEY